MKISVKNILCAALMPAMLIACKKEPAPVQKPAPLTVGAVKTVRREVPLAFEYTGKAQGSKETEVRARVGGILVKRNYTEGSKVEEGQVLFEIDRQPYKIALDKAKAELDRQTADLSAVEQQWERVKTLGKKGFASRKAQDEAQARLMSTRASIAAAQAAYENAKLNYDYTLVTASVSGITGMEVHSEGSLISTAGEGALLTTITQVDPIYVVFSMSDNELFRLGDMIEKGLVKNPRGKSEVKAKIRMGDGSFYEKDGVINFINPAIDQSTGTLKLRAVFENPQSKIISGQFVHVELEGLTRQNAVTLPKEAVMQGANGSFVYVVNANGKIESRAVTTGYTSKTGEWVIDEGLEEGETVVVDNFVKIRPDMPVKVKFAEPEPAAETAVEEQDARKADAPSATASATTETAVEEQAQNKVDAPSATATATENVTK